MAKSLANNENEVDSMYSDYLNELSEASPDTKCIISTVLVARYLERIANHAAYVGESIYSLQLVRKYSSDNRNENW